MADYIKTTKETDSQSKAWRVGGLRLILGLLIKEFGAEKVKKDLELISKQKEFDDVFKTLTESLKNDC